VRRLHVVAALLVILAIATAVRAQETIPPVLVGGGQSATRVANGQTVEVVAAGVSATVNFSEISSLRVSGVAIRTSGGTSSGTVTIRWVTRGRELTLHLGPQTPEVPFGMEGGDIDRRSGAQRVAP